jgi:hypothetical protein
MSGVSRLKRAAGSIQIEGNSLPCREVNFPLFGPVARVVWPKKTAFELAAIAGTTDRAAKDWLSGKFPAPAIVYAAMFVEICKRKHR